MRIPRPVAGRDIRSLPLSPAEAFLLSRIDGSVNERDLALMTGLAPDAVGAALDRLAQLGVVDFGATPVAAARSARPASPGTSSVAPRPSPVPNIVEADSSRVPFGRSVGERASQTPPLYDPAELDEQVDIDRDRKQRILDAFYRLDQLSHYEMLGVDEAADKKQIKSAYYALAPEFHPDKFFRKNLGTYKGKIEALFNRITLSHDVLTSKQRRAEYDDYLSQTQRNRAMAALLEEASRDVASVSTAVDEAVAAAVTSIATTPTGPRPIDERDGPHVLPSGRYAGATPPPGSITPPRPGDSINVPADAQPRSTDRDRREALAKKLGLRTSAPPPQRIAPVASVAPVAPVSSAPPESPSARPQVRAAADTLKARYEAAIGEAKRSQIGRYGDLGRTALERKDYATAANAFRIAASLAPEDVLLQRMADDTQQLAAGELAEGYMKQAQYEANEDRWDDAALSYSKVCAGRPNDARAHERVAHATLKSSGNTRRAVEFARRAVELAPQNPDFHLTLARAYLAAGLEKSVAGEIDRALEAAPNDPRVKEAARELRQEAHAKGKVS